MGIRTSRGRSHQGLGNYLRCMSCPNICHCPIVHSIIAAVLYEGIRGGLTTNGAPCLDLVTTNNLYTHTNTHTHIYMCVCVCVCVCIHIYIYICKCSRLVSEKKSVQYEGVEL